MILQRRESVLLFIAHEPFLLLPIFSRGILQDSGLFGNTGFLWHSRLVANLSEIYFLPPLQFEPFDMVGLILDMWFVYASALHYRLCLERSHFLMPMFSAPSSVSPIVFHGHLNALSSPEVCNKHLAPLPAYPSLSCWKRFTGRYLSTLWFLTCDL